MLKSIIFDKEFQFQGGVWSLKKVYLNLPPTAGKCNTDTAEHIFIYTKATTGKLVNRIVLSDTQLIIVSIQMKDTRIVETIKETYTVYWQMDEEAVFYPALGRQVK